MTRDTLIPLCLGSRTICAAVIALCAGAISPICQAGTCEQWQSVGGSANSFVRAISTFNGELIVGGDLTAAGGVPANRIARWDGQNWHALGAGLNGTVHSLTTFDGDLIVGGLFTQAAGQSAPFIARWDGQSWHPMGDQFNGTVRSLFVHNDQLLAGGDFSMRLAKWDGKAWQQFNPAPFGSVFAMTEFNGDLIAGGGFSHVGGVLVNNIARWDGAQWHALQSPGNAPGTGDGVRALHVHDGDLYVGGFFQLIGGESMKGIARWDGADWHPLGEGVLSYVFSITSLGDLVIAGGAFFTAGDIDTNNIAAWDGSQWIALDQGIGPGGGGSVLAANTWNGSLFVGGFFTQAGDDPQATYLAGFTECPPPGDCIADINGSNIVDVDDLLAVINAWGPCPAPPQACPANITESGPGSDDVNVDDLLAVINAWGACP